MSSRVTTISLDDKTERIKNRIPNFSKFVRQCLLRWDALERDPSCPVERMNPEALVGEYCIPSPTRICLKHWPNGSPRMDDWRTFRDMVEYHDFHKDTDRLILTWPFLQAFSGMGAEPQYWISHRAELVNEPQIPLDEIEIKGNSKPENDRRKKKTPKKRFSIVQLLPFLRSK